MQIPLWDGAFLLSDFTGIASDPGYGVAIGFYDDFASDVAVFASGVDEGGGAVDDGIVAFDFGFEL